MFFQFLGMTTDSVERLMTLWSVRSKGFWEKYYILMTTYHLSSILSSFGLFFCIAKLAHDFKE